LRDTKNRVELGHSSRDREYLPHIHKALGSFFNTIKQEKQNKTRNTTLSRSLESYQENKIYF
jgi:hypothetical protein